VAKDTSFPAWPPGWEQQFTRYYAMGPHLHDYLKEMHREIFGRYDMMSVAEGAGNSFADAHDLVDADRKELDLAYAFDAVDLAKPSGYNLIQLKDVFTRWDSAFSEKGWLAIFLSNHDQARLVSRFGNDSPAYRELSSKMLSTFLLTMRGTPFYYYGDELGMTNPGFDTITDYRDKALLNEYRHRLATGASISDYMKEIAFDARDNGRTPMQWDATAHAGFTTGQPWIKVNPNYRGINVAMEEKDAGSCLNYFRRLVRLRKEYPVLVYGKYRLLDHNNPHVYAYTRSMDGRQLLILLNFSSSVAPVQTGLTEQKATPLLCNYPGTKAVVMHRGILKLRPCEALVLELH
jgi:oligo-1,6-glucosidase